MNKNYKNTKTRRILDLLKHRARTTREVIEGIFPISPDTYKVTKNLLGYMETPKFDYKEWRRQEEKKFYALLSKMHSEKLIEKRGGIDSLWKLTEKGLGRLAHILEYPSSSELPNRNYDKEKSKELILVIFDIPEKFKHKRVWLRKCLRNFEFQMLQRSVWIGKYEIPGSFIHDLRDLKILSYIHILTVQKSGSLLNFSI